jgi:hypothetical protein
MIRTKLTRRVSEFLSDRYNGPIQILFESGDADLNPPYCVVRVGSAENLYPGQADIWEINALIGVFQDSDTTSATTAEVLAAELFAVMDDGEALMAFCDDELAFSAWERLTTEAAIDETKWQHVAGFRAIVSARD